MVGLTSCTAFRLSRYYTWQSILPSLEDQTGSPTFTPTLSLDAVLYDPCDDHNHCRLMRLSLLLSGIPNPSAITHYP